MKNASKMEKVASPFTPKPAPAVFEIDLTEKIDFYEFIDAIEYELIDRALEATNGVIFEAADLLGLKRETLSLKMKKLGIVAWRFREPCKTCGGEALG